MEERDTLLLLRKPEVWEEKPPKLKFQRKSDHEELSSPGKTEKTGPED